MESNLEKLKREALEILLFNKCEYGHTKLQVSLNTNYKRLTTEILPPLIEKGFIQKRKRKDIPRETIIILTKSGIEEIIRIKVIEMFNLTLEKLWGDKNEMS